MFDLISAGKGGKRQYPENEGRGARENHSRVGGMAAKTERKIRGRSQTETPKSERQSKQT